MSCMHACMHFMHLIPVQSFKLSYQPRPASPAWCQLFPYLLCFCTLTPQVCPNIIIARCNRLSSIERRASSVDYQPSNVIVSSISTYGCTFHVLIYVPFTPHNVQPLLLPLPHLPPRCQLSSLTPLSYDLGPLPSR